MRRARRDLKEQERVQEALETALAEDPDWAAQSSDQVPGALLKPLRSYLAGTPGAKVAMERLG